MTIVHAPGVRIQAGCNHISVINCKAMVVTIPDNPSGLPNAFVHNQEYDKTRWGKYHDVFRVMRNAIKSAEGMNNTLPSYLHSATIPM